MTRIRTTARYGAVIAALALTASACGGDKVGEESSDSTTAGTEAAAGGDSSAAAPSADCGKVNIAINPWVGYEANAAVIAHVAETELGCEVEKKNLDEQVSWQGFETGEVDAIVENWGHPDLVEKYIDADKTAQNAGPTGNEGIIGWYVPPWMAEEYPDITNWENLNKYADLFVTSESGGKGQVLDGDPGFVTNDAALVENLDLDFTVVFAGSEAALIESFRTAEANKTPLIGYFYEPQWFLAEVPLVKIDLPAYTDGCDADPAAVACDYPLYVLDKIVSTKFAESGSPAYTLVKNFTWTNDDQNIVAGYIAVDDMSAEDAAKKWVDANPDKVQAWLAGT